MGTFEKPFLRKLYDVLEKMKAVCNSEDQQNSLLSPRFNLANL